jgi:hypothetical protein
LSKLAQARKFREFWALLRSGDAQGVKEDEVKETVAGLAKSAPSFEARLQESIAGEVERSFRTIARPTLEVFLGGALPLAFHFLFTANLTLYLSQDRPMRWRRSGDGR